MSHIILPQIKNTRNARLKAQDNNNSNNNTTNNPFDYLSSLLNSSNNNTDLFHYSKLFFNNCFKTKSPSFKILENNKPPIKKSKKKANQGYSSVISSSIFSKRHHNNNMINNKDYIVDSRKVPELYIMHSNIIKQSISKSNRVNDNQPIDNSNENDSSIFQNLSNKSIMNINQSVEMNKYNHNDKDFDNALLDKNPYHFRKGIDNQVKELINEELTKATLHQLLTNRSHHNINNDNMTKRIINERNNKYEAKKKAKKTIRHKSIKPIKWVFITREMMKYASMKKIEISKYASPYTIIKNDELMKKIFSKNLSFLHLHKQKQGNQKGETIIQ